MTRIFSDARFGSALVATGALFIAVSSASAQAQSSRTERTDPAGVASDRQTIAANRQICVRHEFTGSRLPRTTCRTRAEWEREGGIPTAEE